jgi:hypothetical protein
MIHLGTDEHGDWLGGPTGLTMASPGLRAVLDFPSVLLVPPTKPWMARFNSDVDLDKRAGCEVYLDIATAATWAPDGGRVTAVDLDLDVIRRWDGRVVVLDEDEFAVHQVSFGYPSEVIELALRSCTERRHALESGCEPYASVYRHWLAQVPPLSSAPNSWEGRG